MSNRQAPMIQISQDFKVISIPLSTDIANPHIHKKYLNSKSITTNSTRLKPGKDGAIKLIHDKEENNNNNNNNNNEEEENEQNVILKGTISTQTYTIRWGDGSSWTKQGVNNEEEEEERATPSSTANDDTKPANYNKDYENELQSLRSQLEILKEKEKMSKSQSQAIMVCFSSVFTVSDKHVFS